MGIRILFSLFLMLAFTSCSNQYFQYWESEHTEPVISRISHNSLTGELFILPNEDVLFTLVEKLENAKERIWIETYIWTEKKTLESITKIRGIDIRVLLEGNVYQMPRINDSTLEDLHQKDIPAKITSDRYTFTHMKMWIIDNEWCISTGNWSYTSFTKNREFIYCSRDESILHSLEEIFLADEQDIRPIFIKSGLDSRIGLAPFNLRKFLDTVLDEAKTEIIIFNQAIGDQDILDKLMQKQQNNVHIELCQSTKSQTGSRYHNIPLYSSDSPYLHAKVLLIDGKSVILGSANLTKNAIENNREIMIKIENDPELYQKIKNLYTIDCKRQD